MRLLIKKLLKKHKYPPEGMDDAVQTVMLQCELWTDNYADVQYVYESGWERAAESQAEYNG
jgi:type I restriction enzyme R subunit